MAQAEMRKRDDWGSGEIQALKSGEFGNCRRDSSVPWSEVGRTAEYKSD